MAAGPLFSPQEDAVLLCVDAERVAIRKVRGNYSTIAAEILHSIGIDREPDSIRKRSAKLRQDGYALDDTRYQRTITAARAFIARRIHELQTGGPPPPHYQQVRDLYLGPELHALYGPWLSPEGQQMVDDHAAAL